MPPPAPLPRPRLPLSLCLPGVLLHLRLPSTPVHASPYAPACQVCCYTYGCPRVGDYDFARLYNEAVPDTWNLINGADLVCVMGGQLMRGGEE